MHIVKRMYYLNCNELAASSLLVVRVTYSWCLIQYSFEDTCTVSCMTDWFLKGPTNTITCLANSTWSHPQLFCAPPNNPPHSVGSTFILCKISLTFGLETLCVHYTMSIETMTVTIISNLDIHVSCSLTKGFLCTTKWLFIFVNQDNAYTVDEGRQDRNKGELGS